MSIFICGAVLVTVASALTLDSDIEIRSFGDLPRTVVQSGKGEGCGTNLTGYLLSGQGLIWSDNQPGTARSVAECQQRCDSARNCVGFTARYPRKGPMQCNLYKGLERTYDPRAMAYLKCLKGFKCADGGNYPGFEFSHEGTWKDGVLTVHAKNPGACSKVCKLDYSCVGFTQRHTKSGVSECYLFKNAANKDGPRRDMRANTYSKCALVEQKKTEGMPVDGKPSLPLAMAMLPASKISSCSNGYTASSKDWWWPEYDKLSEVLDFQACTGECDSLHKCVSVVYKRHEKSAECYLYKGIDSNFEPSTMAFTKCPQNAPCDSSTESLSNITSGHFKFSHYGSWEEKGTQVTGLGMKACNIICNSNPECTAMSWKRTGDICTSFFFKFPSQDPTLAIGAEGYSKCSSITGPRTLL